MSNNLHTKEGWEVYKEKELAKIIPILKSLGFTLEDRQPHIQGERFLMQAVTTESGRKLILLGRRVSDDLRVVIKATGDEAGKKELKQDRARREVLNKIKFAYQVFFAPQEILFTEREGFTISIQTFVEQECAFLERPLKEQFTLALKAFKAQEGAHMTTYGHEKMAHQYFDTIHAEGYLDTFGKFKQSILLRHNTNANLLKNLERAEKFLDQNKETIEQYSGFLTHVDFVPHNIRIQGDSIYLLDNSSLRFGNKYEGWARFLNFMALYNPPLEAALVQYVRDNRAEEESLSLKLMRVYRLAELIYYYTESLEKISGDLYTLNTRRIEFWGKVLEAVLENKFVSTEIIEDYRKVRDSLRTEEEKRRQIGLH